MDDDDSGTEKSAPMDAFSQLKQQMKQSEESQTSVVEEVPLRDDANEYLENLLRLLILVKFTATLEQFLKANSIVGTDALLLHCFHFLS